jgi:hypothetical protein
MKSIFIYSILLLSIFYNNVFSQSNDAVITFIQPYSEQKFILGDTLELFWSFKNIPDTATLILDFSTNYGVRWDNVKEDILLISKKEKLCLDTGKFNKSSDLCIFRFRNKFIGTIYSSISDRFTLTKKNQTDTIKSSIRFIQPFKNQEFENGHFVVFFKGSIDSSYKDSKFLLKYSSNNGYSWNTLKENIDFDTIKNIQKFEIHRDSIESEVSKLKFVRVSKITDKNDISKMKTDSSDIGESETFIIKSSKGDNFAIISAIKSIYGNKLPSSEFLDFNFYAKIFKKLGFFMSADIAINSSNDTNMTKYKLSEAGLFLDFHFLFWGNSKYDRQLTFGPLVKIFNTIPYYGVYFGNAELGGKLISSYLNICYMLRPLGVETNPDSLKRPPSGYHHNLYFEFAIHSEKIDLLRYLRIKGGLLVPLGGWQSDGPKSKDIESRIVIEVPIGGIFKF